MNDPIRDQLAYAVDTSTRTYADLAAVSGVDAAQISRLRNGQASMRLETAERLAGALGYRLAMVKVRSPKGSR